MELVALALAGVVAGALTTVAGLGGGILLVAALGLAYPPVLVLALTAPALFVGNASRAAMLRHAIDWRVAGRFALAGVPAALGFTWLAVALPSAWLQAAIGLVVLTFVAGELLFRGGTAPPPGPAGLAYAAGAIAGALSALLGGAGFVAMPLLERLGLPPERLVATNSVGQALVHLCKGVGLVAAAVLTAAHWPAAAALTIGVVAGNAVGARVLKTLPRALFRKLLLGALALAGAQLLAAGVWGL